MMKKLIFVGVLVLAMSGLALAQDFPKFEIFGGYSYLRGDLNSNNTFTAEYYGWNGGQFGGAGNFHGFEGAFVYNLNKWLGVKVDVSGHFGDGQIDSEYSYEEQYYDDYDGEYYDSYYDYEAQKGKARVHAYTVLFGPEFSWRNNSKVRPFAHVLFGFTKIDVSKIDVDWVDDYGYYYGYEYTYIGNVTGSFSKTSFAMALGGGLDINVNKRFAIRVAQIDYVPTWMEIKAKLTNSYEEYYYGSYDGGWREKVQFKIPAERFNNLRLSAGVVFKLDK